MLGYVFATLAFMLLLQSILIPAVPRISYTTFKRYVHEGKVEQVVISDALIRGTLKPGATEEGDKTRTFTTVPVADSDLIRELEARGVDVQGQYDSPFVKTLLSWVLPALRMVAIWVFASRRMSAGGGVMAFGKSRARIYAQKANGVTFAEVADQDEAKEEIQEIIEFLRHLQKFRLLGGKLPRGVLLVGPPGTGKRSWPRPWPARPVCHFSPSVGQSLSSCLSGWARPECAIAANRPRRKRRASCLLMSSMLWARPAASAVLAAAMMNGNTR
jgi:cell division protease FtsH